MLSTTTLEQQIRIIGRKTPSGPVGYHDQEREWVISNAHYVLVGRGPTSSDVVNAVNEATEVVNGNVLITGDDRTSLKVCASASRPGSSLVEVYYGGSLADRRAISQPIYDYIVERSD